MITFDTKMPQISLKKPLDETIYLILRKVFEEENQNFYSKKILKELLYFCTKKVYFTFNDEI